MLFYHNLSEFASAASMPADVSEFSYGKHVAKAQRIMRSGMGG